jgi:hypothetical protein
MFCNALSNQQPNHSQKVKALAPIITIASFSYLLSFSLHALLTIAVMLHLHQLILFVRSPMKTKVIFNLLIVLCLLFIAKYLFVVLFPYLNVIFL